MKQEEYKEKTSELADILLDLIWYHRENYPPKICVNALLLSAFSVVPMIDFNEAELQLCFDSMQRMFDLYKEGVCAKTQEEKKEP